MKLCHNCEELESCILLPDQPCPRGYGSEIPFSQLNGLSTEVDFIELAKPSSEVFCSSEEIPCLYPDHHVKRQIRARVADSPDLSLQDKSALLLLNSTDMDFTVSQVAEVFGISRRKVFYLKAEIEK